MSNPTEREELAALLEAELWERGNNVRKWPIP